MQDVILFGIGEVATEAIPWLEKDYHILLLTDNDPKKWGTMYERYLIEPPDKILIYNCKIMISSVAYGVEITKQLEAMGIERSRICFLYKSKINNRPHFEVCTLEKTLIQYDVLYEEEYKTECRKVLVFCNGYSVYTKQLIENISKRYDDVEFSLLTKEKNYKEKITIKQLKHIYCFRTTIDLKMILEQLPMYDAMQLLWIERNWVSVSELIRNKTKKLNLNVGGSDFYRASKDERELKRSLIACADWITAETEDTVRAFQEYYKEDVDTKIALLPFGIEVLEWINLSWDLNKDILKERFRIPNKKMVITCGHNAIEEHQHMEIISALEKLSEPIKQKVVCVFPMTYPRGREKYISEVDNRLNESGLEYVILTDFMDFQSMAEYALISDIMIHVQTTDQLSSTMLEEMYAGSVVIAGSWLPYQSLHEMGIYFLDVDSIPDVTAVLEDVVKNFESYKEKCKGNSKIVWNHSSWDVLAPKWRALWD